MIFGRFQMDQALIDEASRRRPRLTLRYGWPSWLGWLVGLAIGFGMFALAEIG